MESDPPITSTTLNGARLVFQQFGPDDAPPIILVAGASSSMDWWDEGFCRLLAAGDDSGPRRVVRYDLRDTGQSETVPPGEARYSGDDLIADLVALIEHLEGAPAHVVGISFGAGLTQQLALRHPELLATVTLMSTTPIGEGGRLPSPIERMRRSFETPAPDPDWSDPIAVGDSFVETERIFSGSIPVDEDRVRGIGVRSVSRTSSPMSSQNHWSVPDGPGARTDTSSIRIPTLVIHGSEDPMFPLPHGEKLAELIPGARLVVVPGMGHQNPPPPTWPQVVGEILNHTAY